MAMEELLVPFLHRLPQASHPFLRGGGQGRLPGIGKIQLDTYSLSRSRLETVEYGAQWNSMCEGAEAKGNLEL